MTNNVLLRTLNPTHSLTQPTLSLSTDQPPSASPLPWTIPTGAKTHLFDCVCRA